MGYLKPLALPGGDRAAREPWRMAASALHALGRGDEIERRFSHAGAGVVRQMLEKRVNCPFTSSAGRLFDAAAGLLSVKEVMRFEGQGAMLLEGLAEQYGRAEPMADSYVLEADGVLNVVPLLARLADTRDTGHGAALFHATLAEGLAKWVQQAAAEHSLDEIVLGGGCFLNHVLSRTLREHLRGIGLRVFEASQLPPNDGGLSLGQAWVAMRTED
jgi:hydrogenase maturation protein HypF